jgi:ribosomal protein S18 acetylase RimI-like enzyme
VPAPTWIAGVTVRAFDDRDGRSVKALLDEAYAWDAHYTPQPYEEWHRYMTEHDEFDPSLWFLAERNGELIACALHWKEHNRRGWLKDIAVHASARGAGLGKSLIRHGLRAYAERGVERVGLKVDAANPTGAAVLYAREGFVIDQHLEIWRKPL